MFIIVKNAYYTRGLESTPFNISNCNLKIFKIIKINNVHILLLINEGENESKTTSIKSLFSTVICVKDTIEQTLKLSFLVLKNNCIMASATSTLAN